MSTMDPADDQMREDCHRCDRVTPHDVDVQIRTESTKQQNAEFSREPYRVSVCLECGEESVVRMNNA